MGLRFLFYCHDTFGLGYFRRTLSLAKHFTALLPEAEALIVTGSPLAHAFELPPRVDYIKLPTVTKRSDGTYAAHSLTLEATAIRDLCAVLLRETAQAYHPDVFLVDHAPLGLKGEALLLLDEPTVALDAQAEQIIVQALERLMVGRTTLVVAHRLSTIQRADLVLVIDKGHIVEAGTPTELLAAGGHYHQLYTLQFQTREPASPSSLEHQPIVDSRPPQADTNEDLVDARTNPI